MANGRVLIIEQDEWESALLAKFLREAGHEVEVAGLARSGFDRVRASEPDCILCNVNLPDIDGFWVARRVRAEPTRVRLTPFLFLTDAGDVEGRLQGLNVGADLFLIKPFRADEVVAQVGALIDMANRLKAGPSELPEGPPSSARPTAFQGDLAQMSLTTVLTLLELERQTGRLKVKCQDGPNATFELSDGAFVASALDDEPYEAVALLRQVLAWKRGSFQFRSAKIERAGERHSLSGLMLKAMQLEDEAGRN